MALPTPDDIADGLRTKWGATPALTAIIPVARVFAGRVAEGVAWPNARLLIVEDTRELTSGEKTLLKYRATIEANVVAAANAKAIRQAIDSAFCGSANDISAGLTVTNGTVISSRGQPGGQSKVTGERVNGEDVVTVSAVFIILVQGAR